MPDGEGRAGSLTTSQPIPTRRSWHIIFASRQQWRHLQHPSSCCKTASGNSYFFFPFLLLFRLDADKFLPTNLFHASTIIYLSVLLNDALGKGLCYVPPSTSLLVKYPPRDILIFILPHLVIIHFNRFVCYKEKVFLWILAQVFIILINLFVYIRCKHFGSQVKYTHQMIRLYFLIDNQFRLFRLLIFLFLLQIYSFYFRIWNSVFYLANQFAFYMSAQKCNVAQMYRLLYLLVTFSSQSIIYAPNFVCWRTFVSYCCHLLVCFYISCRCFISIPKRMTHQTSITII